MPGICCVVCPTASGNRVGNLFRNSPEGLLSEMLDRMRHQPWYREERYSQPSDGIMLGRLSLGFTNPGPQPAWNEDGSLVGVMHGEIYNYAEERGRLGAAGHEFKTTSHAELLLHGFEQLGKAFFTGLHGCFAAAIWDSRRRLLLLTNDRFGMRPLYYVHLPGKLLVASEIKALLADPAVSRQSDVKGIAQFVTFGQLLGQDTLLADVHTLPAAACVIYEAANDQLSLDQYWRSNQIDDRSRRSERELLDEIDHVFHRAVERRVQGPEKLGMSLSGGLDSRTILAAMDHSRTPITTVSMGVGGCLDHRSAEQLAACSNRRHHCCNLDQRVLEQYEDSLRKMVRLTDGHYLSQGIMQYTMPAYRDLGIQVLLRGHAGELMHLDKAYSFSFDRETFALQDEAALECWLVRHLSAFMIGELDEPLLAGMTHSELASLARESLRAALDESAGIEPPVQRISHLFVTQRMRRETALSMVEFGSLMETRLPYLDNDLVDLLLSVPSQLRLADRIQKHILERRLPAFLDIVNANTGVRVGASPAARFFGTMRQRVFARLRVPGYQPYERLGLWLRRELRPLVEKLLLNDRFLSRGTFNPQSIRRVVAEHCARRRNYTYLIMALMILELGQQELFESSNPAPPEKQDVPPTAAVGALAARR